jgi:hypothetical protein
LQLDLSFLTKHKTAREGENVSDIDE